VTSDQVTAHSAAIPAESAQARTGDPARPPFVRRAELFVTGPDAYALAAHVLEPDPLERFARVLETLRPDRGETAVVAVDLLPLSRRQRRRHHRKLVEAARKATGEPGHNAPAAGAARRLGDIWSGMQGGAGASQRGQRGAARPGPTDQMVRRTELRPTMLRITETDALFAIQVLLRATATTEGRAVDLVNALRDCFAAFTGSSWFKTRGIGPTLSLGRHEITPFFLGSDMPWHRRWFDYRLGSGLFAPWHRGHPVAGKEVAAFLRPPTKHCASGEVLRSGGLIPAPPAELRTYRYQPELLPLGEIDRSDGTVHVGVPERDTKFIYTSGRADYGKALALDTPIPTPGGWTTMGQLKVDDQVFDEAGRPCRVIGATSVMYDHACYEMVFSDGSRIVTDAEHRWLTWDYAARKSEAEAGRRARRRAGRRVGPDQSGKRRRPGVRTTEEIRGSLRARGGTHHNHAIPICAPLAYPERPLPLDPYVLGVWLGDGTSEGYGLTCADVEIVETVRAAGYTVKKRGDSNGTRPYAWGIYSVTSILRSLGVLHNKHIPELYLRASVDQRLALLQGLMDTDGSANQLGHCEFSTSRPALAEGVFDLAVGLGIKPVLLRDRARLNGRDYGERYRITFTPDLPVFRLPRKLARLRLGDKDRQRRRRYRYIVDVQPIPSVPVRCIAVDSPSHLYLAGRACISTHNTTGAVNRFLHWALCTPHGGLFLDPHVDALQDMLPFLVEVADRLLIVNLADRDKQGGWNLCSMAGRSRADIEGRVDAIVDSVATVTGWGERNGRALNLISQAAKSVIELAVLLPADLQPTIFQITTLLSSEAWREAVLPYLSAPLQAFWRTRFTLLDTNAITPVTNLLDRLSNSRSISALLGASQSSFDLRQAMDQGKLVLVCPAGSGLKEQLIANFVVRDLYRAALTRIDTPRERRRPFYAVFDELQIYDEETFPEMLEQLRKFAVKGDLLNQDPRRLRDDTWAALTTNRSILQTSTLGEGGAKLVAGELGGQVTPDTIMALDRHTFVTQVRLGDQTTKPFLIRTVPPERLWAEHRDERSLPALEARVDQTMRRRKVDDTLAELHGLDGRIRDWLRRNRPPSGPGGPGDDGDRDPGGRPPAGGRAMVGRARTGSRERPA
jgi:hypothetical protein